MGPRGQAGVIRKDAGVGQVNSPPVSSPTNRARIALNGQSPESLDEATVRPMNRCRNDLGDRPLSLLIPFTPLRLPQQPFWFVSAGSAKHSLPADRAD